MISLGGSLLVGPPHLFVIHILVLRVGLQKNN
jgi:hypothetical protein